MAYFFSTIFCLLFLALLFPCGTWICRIVLKNVPKVPASTPVVLSASGEEVTSQEIRVGWKIGYLERFIVVFAGVYSVWEIFAVVAALKTIARYKELDQKISAEYFLIGSMASLAWALVCAQAFKKAIFSTPLLAPLNSLFF